MVVRTLIVAALLLVSTQAEARHRQTIDANGNYSDPRPARWCAWFLRRHLGIAKSAFPRGDYNRAVAFRSIGHPASPGINVIVVWWHHVGLITGGTPGHWVILSGNDGHTVRERVRSISGAIAFRSLS